MSRTRLNWMTCAPTGMNGCCMWVPVFCCETRRGKRVSHKKRIK